MQDTIRVPFDEWQQGKHHHYEGYYMWRRENDEVVLKLKQPSQLDLATAARLTENLNEILAIILRIKHSAASLPCEFQVIRNMGYAPVLAVKVSFWDHTSLSQRSAWHAVETGEYICEA